MGRSTGYLIALSSGVFLGWIAQQFWFAGFDQRALRSENNLLRNEQRMDNLKELRRKSTEVIVIKDVDERQNAADDLDVIGEQVTEAGVLQKKDFDSILSVAAQKLSQNDVQGAVLYLYDVRSQVAYQSETDYLDAVHDFILQIEKQFEDGRLKVEMLDVFRQLISLEPDYAPYYLSLAHWQILDEDFYEAEQTLSLAKFDLSYKDDISLMENTIKDLQERSIARVIPLKKAGEHYLAEVQIDELYSLSLMLDTGASMTVVKDDFVLRELPELLYDSEALSLKTANGLVQGRKILVRRFSMTDLTLNDVSIAVLPLQEFSYDGLLGMNVLGRFEFRIDQERQELILHSK